MNQSVSWGAQSVPSMSGKVALVTGANSGLGAATATALAAAGARVILACRSADRAQTVRVQLEGDHHLVEVIDLADLQSVAQCAQRLRQSAIELDLLICNAGVMALPKASTADGFETHFAVNHLGHFALTCQVLELLAPTGKVVTVASHWHRAAPSGWDPKAQGRYHPWMAYGRSKLANMLFASELDRRLKAAGSAIQSLAAHPGYAVTNLVHVAPQMTNAKLTASVMKLGDQLIAQSAQDGALPTLRAATDGSTKGGEYFGPDGWFEIRGKATEVSRSVVASDPQAAAELWALSEKCVGMSFDVAERLHRAPQGPNDSSLSLREGSDLPEHTDEPVSPVGGDVIAEIETIEEIAQVEREDLLSGATIVKP